VNDVEIERLKKLKQKLIHERDSKMTNNQLIAYDKIDDVPGFVTQLGRSIALSKMFGCESEEQGQIMALECIAKKMPPLSIAERFHLIHGKLSKKSEAMLAEFREVAKGMHRVICRDAACCEIQLVTSDRQEINFRLTWEEAKQEPFVYEGKESTVVELLNSGKTDKLKLKPKYATPRARMQMMWSRLVSDSIRCVAPEIVCGTYTPEEVGDFDEMPLQVRNQPVAEPEQPVESVEDAEVVETVSVKNTVENKQPVESTTITSPTAEEMTAELQIEPESVAVDGPCLEHQITAIKEVIARAKQQGELDIVDRLKAFLAKNNVGKLADLTYNEANRLVEAVEQKIVHAFFEADLRAHSKN